MTTASTVHFADFALDVDGRSLKKAGDEIFLRPQAMEVLCYLARNPGRPLSKKDIFHEIWPGLNVTDDSLVQCIGDIRRALDDDEHRIVKTVPRRGYLFAGVTVDGPSAQPQAGTERAAARSRVYAVKLALLGAAAIVVVWAIVHWFVVAGHK